MTSSPVNMHTDECSNDSFVCSEGSIVSSEVFGKELASKLKEIKPIPVVTLDKEKPSTSKGENVRQRLQTLATGWNEWDGKVPSSKVIPDKSSGGNRYEKMEMRDPLPISTAFGLCSIDRKSKDTSPYPPPDPTQGRFNCSFPAPKPIDESELPHYNRVEFFLKAQEWVEKDIQKSNNDKTWFESFIKEKIQFNVADTNLDGIRFYSLRKGLAASQVIHPDLGRLKELITCQLCEQIALNPKSCKTCTRIYCLGCIRWLQSLPGDIELTKVNAADQFMCINAKCLVSIEINGYPKYGDVENEEIRKFYTEATFTCHRQFCDATLKVDHILYHLTRCRNGPIVWEFDKTLQLSYVSGPVREELNRKTISLKSILPAHLKLKEPTQTHEQRWHRKALGCAFFVKGYQVNPTEFHPELIRAQSGFGSAYWNNVKRQYDPTEPIEEGEQFCLAIGMPSCSTKPISDVPRRWPTTRCSRVPQYLIDYSLNWKRWSRYVEPRDDDSLSTTSTNVLYAIDVEDLQTPFIRIDPFERLAPADAENVMEWLEKSVPSIVNPRSMYKEPAPSTKEHTIFYREKRRGILNESFANRPKSNLPAMLDSQLKVINDCAAKCPEKQLFLSISMLCISVWENGRMRPRPCWIVIMDGNMEVVYETFVRYREIEYIDSNWHGLSPRDLKYARNLMTARDQVVKYLACADKIVGYGLVNHLMNLGLAKEEIRAFHPKMRDINNFYSPYNEHPSHLHAIAFLWFTGYTLPVEAHSPVVETTTVLRLYFLQWEEIERVAQKFDGIHNENVNGTCGNRVTSALLYEFDQGVKKGVCNWPREWANHPQRRRRIPYPVFSDNCILPDKEMLKSTADQCKINLEKLNSHKTLPLSSQSPRARMLRQAKAYRDARKKESIAETIANAKREAEEDNNPGSMKRRSSASSIKSNGSNASKSSKTSESSANSDNTVIFIDPNVQAIPKDDEW